MGARNLGRYSEVPCAAQVVSCIAARSGWDTNCVLGLGVAGPLGRVYLMEAASPCSTVFNTSAGQDENVDLMATDTPSFVGN